MAGRGRALVSSVKKVGTPTTLSLDISPDVQRLVNSISEINLSNVNSSVLNTVQNQFKELCTSRDSLKNVLTKLHHKALSDVEFGRKLAVAMQTVMQLEIDGTSVRPVFLTVLQEEFNLKDTLLQTDKPRVLNAVTFLGNAYHYLKIEGAELWILGMALLEYFDLLIKGGEDELKLLTTQVALNNKYLSRQVELTEKYKNLQNHLRETLTTKTLCKLSKCWILLAIDLMSHNTKPLDSTIRDFYFKNLGEAYIKLEALTEKNASASATSPEPSKWVGNTHKSPTSPSGASEKGSSGKKNSDLSDKFIDMNLSKSGDEGKDKPKKSSPHGKNAKPGKKWNSNSRHEHDDRFERHENYYGVQQPRTSKSDLNKKKNKSGGDTESSSANSSNFAAESGQT